MSVDLFIEKPKGTKVTDTVFLPGDPVRVAGRVKGLFGIPIPGLRVSLTIEDGEKIARSVTTNAVGNYWWDVHLPVTPGPYSLSASTIASGRKTIAFSISQAAMPVDFMVSVDPEEPGVGGSVRIAARVLLNGFPVQGVPVFFHLTNPDGVTEIASDPTNAYGIASVVFLVTQEGAHTVLVKAPAVNETASLSFFAELLGDGGPPPEPTPGPGGGIGVMPLLIGGAVLLGAVAVAVNKR